MRSQEHWDDVYLTKSFNKVSWFQKEPRESLDLINRYVDNKDVAIIDIGGGESFLVDKLLALGYTNITVLDISSYAIDKVKKRLGFNAAKVKWIVSDIFDFEPSEQYDVWHDRAAFHFLIKKNHIEYYKKLVNNINDNGYLFLATFASDGPERCSGLNVNRYSVSEIESFLFNFSLIEDFKHNHLTPSGLIQKFNFTAFIKK